MREDHRPSFQLSFVSSEAEMPMSTASEILGRVRSVAPWDEASVCPEQADFPRVHISWHSRAGFNVHCFEDDESLGQFLVTSRDFSPPSVEINLGGQTLERWPCELFVAEPLAIEALKYFLDDARLNPALCWVGTGEFPRETLWEGREQREAWEHTHRKL